MKGNALLIGGTGFAGTHMRSLLEAKYKVISTSHSDDIRNRELVNQIVKMASPDVVVYLAAITTVRESFEEPAKTYNVGFWGMLNLLFALKKHGFRGRLLNISSSEVYGFPKEDQLPLVEGAPLCPMSPYAVSKIATEALCYQWSQTESFEKIVTARPFTHIGPGQSARFSISSFAKQIAEIMTGRRKPVIHVGNLDSTRDVTDVRDTVRAYAMLIERGENGSIYNVCSNRETYLRKLLDELINLLDIDISVEQDVSLIREKEQQRICGSFQKLHNETGWLPEIPLKQSLSDTLSYWLDKLKREG